MSPGEPLPGYRPRRVAFARIGAGSISVDESVAITCSTRFQSRGMPLKILRTDFGQFTFLDNHAVVARAYSGVNIDREKVERAIGLIESELPGNYAMILDRKADYSVVPVEVYNFFASRERLKAIAIVKYREPDFLPDNMEKRIYKGMLRKFTSIDDAHRWIRGLFAKR